MWHWYLGNELLRLLLHVVQRAGELVAHVAVLVKVHRLVLDRRCGAASDGCARLRLASQRRWMHFGIVFHGRHAQVQVPVAAGAPEADVLFLIAWLLLLSDLLVPPPRRRCRVLRRVSLRVDALALARRGGDGCALGGGDDSLVGRRLHRF